MALILGSLLIALSAGTALAMTITGTDGPDSRGGSTESDTMTMLGGDDNAVGYAGNDLIYGNAGLDWLAGSDGDDTIYGGSESDVIGDVPFSDGTIYEVGNDRLFGETGPDGIKAGPGNDHADGGTENDFVAGGTGADTIMGGYGNDRIYDSGQYREPFLDRMYGGPGNDTVFAQNRPAKRDIVNCGPGRDRATVDKADVVRGCEKVSRSR